MQAEVTPLDDASFKRQITDLVPHLRAFARSLCGNASQADDIAQEAMLKAWRARASFEPGTNMKAWCFTILRNVFYSEKRKSWRQQPLDPEVAEATLVSGDDSGASLELLALRNALNQLPEDQRECLIMVGAGGLSYEDVAVICDCAVGTIKSRVSRARKALAEILESNMASFNTDGGIKAADAFDDIMRQADLLAAGPNGAKA